MFDSRFILLPIIQNTVFKKSYHKKYIFITFCFSNFKKVFILLAKIITFYIKIIISEFWVLSLKKFISTILKDFNKIKINVKVS